ncbi:MAG: DUF421 domain-containing protein [Buchananella hordeovulneris]|nr:DUF421 domain-containing protein [Buchananella hordeovulneris]
MSLDLMFYLQALAKFATGFLIIAAYLKLSNKLQTGQLTAIDYIGNFVLGGIISGIIYNNEIPFHRFLLVLLIALTMIALLNFATSRFMVARRAVTSDPLPIIINGTFQVGAEDSKSAKFDVMTFISQLRSRGIYSLEDIAFAQIEPDGSLTVIKKGDGVINSLLVRDGEVLETYLEAVDRDTDWLLAQLAEVGVELEDVYLVELSREKHLFIVKKDGTCVAKEIN